MSNTNQAKTETSSDACKTESSETDAPDTAQPVEQESYRLRAVNTGLPPGMMTRGLVAKKLGVSVSEVIRREKTGEIVPVRQNGRGWNLYTDASIGLNGRLTTKGAAKKPDLGIAGTPYSPQEAIAVFTALSEGKTLIEAVLATQLHPNIVESASYDYARMTGSLIVDSHVMTEINKLPLEGSFPLRSAAELLNVLKTCSEESMCTSCHERPRSKCRVCIKQEVREHVRKYRRDAAPAGPATEESSPTLPEPDPGLRVTE